MRVWLTVLALSLLALSQPSTADEEEALGSTLGFQQDAPDDRIAPHIAAALACYRAHDLRCSISELEKARAILPNHAQTRFMLGNAHYRAKHWRAAIIEYRAAARFRPDHPDTHLNLGFSYYQVGRTEEATAAWVESVQRSPADPLARTALAVGLFTMQRTEEALHQLSRALLVRPSSCESQQLATDVRWQGNALAQVERLCHLRGDQ